MKTLKKTIFFITAVLALSSCAAVRSPLTGVLYSDVKSPLAVTGNEISTKVGKAEATSVLGIVATGDASIDAAAKSAGITKIHHVDQQAVQALGIFARYTVYVYGE